MRSFFQTDISIYLGLFKESLDNRERRRARASRISIVTEKVAIFLYLMIKTNVQRYLLSDSSFLKYHLGLQHHVTRSSRYLVWRICIYLLSEEFTLPLYQPNIYY
jgi:hypothetical protein